MEFIGLEEALQRLLEISHVQKMHERESNMHAYYTINKII